MSPGMKGLECDRDNSGETWTCVWPGPREASAFGSKGGRETFANPSKTERLRGHFGVESGR